MFLLVLASVFGFLSSGFSQGLPSTGFTRSFLRATNNEHARSLLGFASSNAVVVDPINQDINWAGFSATNMGSLLVTGAVSAASFSGDGSALTNLLWFDVTDYGAVGDGATSDVGAIAAALTNCQTSGGGVVYFPPGTYILDDTQPNSAYTDQNGTAANINIMSNNVHLVGSGMGATIIKRISTSQNLNMFNSFNTTNISIRDMTLDANLSTNVQNMTSFYTNENVIVTRTEWKNHDGSDWDALEMAPVSAFISDSVFTNISANALAIDGSVGLGTVGFVDNCYFSYCGYKSYTFYTNTASWYPGNWAAIQLRQGTFYLSNVRTEGCPTSLQLLGTWLDMSNCEFEGTGASETNMFIPQGTVVMNNCNIQASGSGSCAVYASGLASYGGTSGGSGAVLYMNNCNVNATSGHGIIASNRLVMANSTVNGATPGYTVVLSGGNAHRLTGNYFGNNGSRVLSVDGPVSNSIFSGNYFTSGGCVWTVTTGGANSFIGNIFDGGAGGSGTYLQVTSASNVISANHFINGADFKIATGSAGSFISANKFQPLTFVNTVAVTLRDNLVAGTLTATAAQVAGAKWLGNTDASGVPINERGESHSASGQIGCSDVDRWPTATLHTTLSPASKNYVTGNTIFTNLLLSVLSSGSGTNYTLTLYTNGAASALAATAAGNGGDVTGNSGTNGVTLISGDYWAWHIMGNNPTSALKTISANWNTVSY